MATTTVQPGASAVMDPKNVKGMPRDVGGEREWSNGLFACFNEPGTCLLSWYVTLSMLDFTLF